MEFRQFLKLIYRNKYMIIVMCLSAMITATLLTYVLSERYQSSTKILIRPQKSIDLVPKKEEILNFPVSYLTPIETASKTYTEIIKSRMIAERVVTMLHLDSLTEEEGIGFQYLWRKIKTGLKGFFRKTWDLLRYGYIREQDSFNRAAAQVQKALSVKPTKETYLFELQAEAKSSALSAAIANAAAKVFVDYLQEMSITDIENETKSTEDKILFSTEELDRSRNAVVEFKRKEGIASLKDELELEAKSLAGLEESFKSVNTEIASMLAKRTNIIRQLSDMKKFSRSASKTIDNPLNRKLRTELTEKEVKLAVLRELYTEEHKELQSLQKEVDEIKSKLKQEAPTLDSEEILSVDPVYQDLSVELARVNTQLEFLKARRNGLRSVIREKKKKIEQMPAKEAELSKLELITNLNEETHKLLSREHEELKMMASKEAPDIRIISKAIPPIYPVRPIKFYHAVLAGILSLIAGIGIALVGEYMNLTIRSVAEAERGLNLPVLMTIPQINFNNNNNKIRPLPLMNVEKKAIVDERRNRERVRVQLPIEIRSCDDQRIWKGETIDLSMSGVCCFLEGAAAFTARERVRIYQILDAGSEEKEAIDGVILRTGHSHDERRPSILGIEFLTMAGSSSKKIREIIEGAKSTPLPLLPTYFEEPIRGIRTDLLFMNKKGMSTFLITSGLSQEGKSTIVSNLAASCIEINKKVVLVDANLRSPCLHTMFGISNRIGLSQMLLTKDVLRWEDAKSFLKLLPSGLCVLPSGESVNAPSSLLASDRMRQLITSLKTNFDITLVDSPSLLTCPDPALLASMMDGTILVLSAGTTSLEDGQRAKNILERAHANILGTVLNYYQDNATSYYRRG